MSLARHRSWRGLLSRPFGPGTSGASFRRWGHRTEHLFAAPTGPPPEPPPRVPPPGGEPPFRRLYKSYATAATGEPEILARSASLAPKKQTARRAARTSRPSGETLEDGLSPLAP